ncbi:MAG TPA: RDD family protein [Candidatus Kapabacteria bacterium]|nr:RDD family protein [Candidatus Kapabacteria bacterium]
MEYTMSSPTIEAPREQAMVQYAGFWRRFLAWFLDALILGAVIVPIAAMIGIGATGITGSHYYLMHGGDSQYYMGNHEFAAGSFFLLVTLWFVIPWLYFALMESSKNQATLGKMALGLRVTDLDGRRISFGKATGRYFAKILSAMTLLIGYIMAAFTAKKQTLHDFVAGTLVLSKQSAVSAQVAENAFAA